MSILPTHTTFRITTSYYVSIRRQNIGATAYYCVFDSGSYNLLNLYININ